MAQFYKNEAIASKRKVRVFMYLDDGATPAPWQTDWTGCVWVDQSTGNAVLATGTFLYDTRSFAFSDQTITAFPGSNNATITGHVFHDANGNGVSGIGPVRLTTTGTLPAGLATATDYYLVWVDANTVAFATTAANAGAGTKIAISGSGSGTIKITAAIAPFVTVMPIDGSFTYTAPQTETNFDGSELALHVEKTGMHKTEVTVNILTSASDAFSAVGEGANTYGDLIRLMVGILAGKVSNYTTNTFAFKSLDGSKTRMTFTVDQTGRLTNVPGDLT